MSDQVRPIVGALNEYLHTCHMYRAEALSVTEIVTLDAKSRQALDTLQRVFPYFVTLAGGRQRAVWFTETAHSMTHCQWGTTTTPPAWAASGLRRRR